MKNRYHILSESPKVSDQELEEYMDFEALLENRKAYPGPGKSRIWRYWALGISFFLMLSIGAAGWFWWSDQSTPLNTEIDHIENTTSRIPTDHNTSLGLGVKNGLNAPTSIASNERVVPTPPKNSKKVELETRTQMEDAEQNKAASEIILPPAQPKAPEIVVSEAGSKKEEAAQNPIQDDEATGGSLAKETQKTDSGPRVEIEEITSTKKESYETYVQTSTKEVKKKTTTSTVKEAITSQAISKNHPPSTVRETQSTVKKEEYTFIDAKPQGGTKALYQYLAENLVYPEGVKDTTIEGEVLVSFTITREGKVANAKIKQSLGTLFDQEAIRVIKGMPDWIPATLNGHHVESQLSIPLYFNLNDGSKEKR